MRNLTVIKQKLLWFKRTDGAVLLMFALMLPIFFSICALAIDGPLVLIKKARLSDGLNEGILAIAAVNNRGTDEAANKQILNDYLNAYLPNADIKMSYLDVIVDTDFVRYNAKAIVDIDSIIPLQKVGLPSFGEHVSIGNVGNVIKHATPTAADIALVVDFSRSMEKQITPNSGGKTRITILRDALDKIITDGLTLQGNQFAIVPYDIGVPVNVSGKNEAGGNNIGCSVMFVPKASYKINYQFWSDKFVDMKHEVYKDPAYNYLYLRILWLMDWAMYGQALYSCWNSTNSIYSNDSLISNEYGNVINNLKAMRSTKEGGKGYRSIMNIDSIDFTATFNNMFDITKVITFTQPFAPNLQEHRMFGEMCESAMGMTSEYSPNNHQVTTEPDGYDSSKKVTIVDSYKTAVKYITTAKQNTSLISLTDDEDELNAFQNMQPSGGTETMTGVLRAVPELVKGSNKRKVMVVISDGFDSDAFGNKSQDNLRLTREFIEKHNVCTKIEDGFKNRGKNETFSMYFISLSAPDKNQEEIKLWSQCVGPSRVSTADDYQSLLSSLAKIMNTETGHFIN